MIAGLEQGKGQYSGRKDIGSVSPHLRGFGLMFRITHFSSIVTCLIIRVGLRMQGLPRSEIDQSVKKELERVNF